MQATNKTRPPEPCPEVTAEWREVVRDVGGEAQVFLRLTLSGGSFARGTDEPLVLIDDAASRFSVVGADGRSLSAYFDRSVPEAQLITVAFGDGEVEYFHIAVERQVIRRLEPFA
jgi:hypothetical protein